MSHPPRPRLSHACKTSKLCLFGVLRFTQVLACICNFAAIFDKNLRELAHIIDWVAEIVERVVAGCLGGQVATGVITRKRRDERGQ